MKVSTSPNMASAPIIIDRFGVPAGRAGTSTMFLLRTTSGRCGNAPALFHVWMGRAREIASPPSKSGPRVVGGRLGSWRLAGTGVEFGAVLRIGLHLFGMALLPIARGQGRAEDEPARRKQDDGGEAGFFQGVVRFHRRTNSVTKLNARCVFLFAQRRRFHGDHCGPAAMVAVRCPTSAVLRPPYPRSAATKSAQRSPIMIDGALVLPDTNFGMIEASATYRPCTPRTRSRGSHTAWSSDPIRAVPTG